LAAMKEGLTGQLLSIDFQLLLTNELRLGHFATYVYNCKLQFYIAQVGMAQTRKRRQFTYVYHEHLYNPSTFQSIQRLCSKIPKSSLKPDPEPTAKGRLTYSFENTDPRLEQIVNDELLTTMRQLTGIPTLELCTEIPIEYRVYGPGSSMNWHTDRQMLPHQLQYECVITLKNTSDSETLLKLGRKIQPLRPEPNSLFVVRAKGIQHSVSPLTKGTRSILKVAFKRPTE
jgi:hypothetical protein